MEQQRLRFTSQQLIDRIKPRLYSTEHQSDRIKNLVTVPIAGDLVLSWYADVSDLVSAGQGETACAPISVSLAENLGLSLDDLLRLGQEHTRGTYKMQSMQDAMGCLLGLPDEKDSIPMYILCNHSLQFGAAAVLDAEVQSRLTEMWPDGFYLLPSSIHEMLAVSKTAADPAELVEKVRQINSDCTVLQPQDILSNHVFAFEEGRIVVAA